MSSELTDKNTLTFQSFLIRLDKILKLVEEKCQDLKEVADYIVQNEDTEEEEPLKKLCIIAKEEEQKDMVVPLTYE